MGRPRGVTVIEVLFAIGVVVIGLLGVIALLPVAGYQAGQGLVADQGAVAGRSAAQEFDIRGMRRQDAWGVPTASGPTAFLDYGGQPGYRSQIYELFRQEFLAAFPQAAGQMALAKTSSIAFCIDPRFVGVHGAVTPANTPFDSRFFPYYANSRSNHASGLPIPDDIAAPRMVRISLRSAPGASLMTALQAEQLFVAHDDLAFDLPGDKTLPPQQNFGSPGPDKQWGTADDVITKRQYDGAISWMATIAPKLDLAGGLRDLYTLSIVVFNRRDSSMEMNGINERIAYVKLPTDFYSAGFGGGDVMLTVTAATQEDAEEALALRDGNWLMFGGAKSISGVVVPQFKWYRVLAADPDVQPTQNANEWTREVTLQGPDWDFTWDTANNPPTWDMRRPQVTLIRGVIAVYEKTIRLETTSLW